MCKGTSSHSCDHCEKLFQSGWQLREHLKDLHGEVIVEEEEKMVTRRRSSRLGRSSNLQNVEEDELEDEISIWDDFGEETEMFGEDEEGRYTDACRRKRCVVKILQMKNFDMGDSNSDEESESFDLGSTCSEESVGDFVEDILTTIVNKVVLLTN